MINALDITNPVVKSLGDGSGTGTPHWSPDGTRVAFADGGFSGAFMYVSEVTDTDILPAVAALAGSEGSFFGWAADSRHIAARSAAGISVADVSQGVPVPNEISVPASSKGFWSPIGSQLAITAGQSVLVVDVANGVAGTPRTVMTSTGTFNAVHWAPGATRLVAIATTSQTPLEHTAYVADPNATSTATAEEITAFAPVSTQAIGVGKGDRFVAIVGNEAEVFDMSASPPAKVVSATAASRELRWSRGREVAAYELSSGWHAFDFATGAQTKLELNGAALNDVLLLGSGDRFIARRHGDETGHLVRTDLSTSSLLYTPVASSSSLGVGASASPDGAVVAFFQSDDFGADIPLTTVDATTVPAGASHVTIGGGGAFEPHFAFRSDRVALIEARLCCGPTSPSRYWYGGLFLANRVGEKLSTPQAVNGQAASIGDLTVDFDWQP